MKYTIVMLLVWIVSFQTSFSQAECKNPLIDTVSVVLCLRIIDGDTFKFQLQNDVFSVRVLGLDCYETKRNDRLKMQADRNGITTDSALVLGLKAKAFADSILSGKLITIVRDFSEKNFDTYNRLLRRVVVNGIDYTEMLNKHGLNSNETTKND